MRHKYTLLAVTASLLAIILPLQVKGADELTYRTDMVTSHLFSDIIQDEKGYIWIATEYGLNKFDGSHFTHYYSTASPGSLSSNSVRRLGTDSDGNLFALCDNGIMIYNRITDSFLEIKDGSGLAVRGIDMTSNSDITLIASEDGPIYRYSQGSLTEYPRPDLLTKDNTRIHRIFIDNRNSVWIGTLNDGIYRIDGERNRIKHYYEPDMDNESVNSIVSTPDGTIFVAASTKIWRHSTADDRLVPVKHDAAFSSIRDVIVDSHGRPIVGTYGNGLYYIDIEENCARPLSDLTDLPPILDGANVTAVFQDRDDNLWTGCFNEGLSVIHMTPSAFGTINMLELPGGTSRPISMIHYDRHGNLWIGQEKNGLIKLDQDKKYAGHYLDDTTPLCMTECHDGNYHIGLYDRGVAILRQPGGKTTINNFDYTRIKSIATTADNRILYAVFNRGIVPSHKNLTLPDSSQYRFINKLYIDSDSILWIAHYNGINCLDTKSMKSIVTPIDTIAEGTICYAVTERRGTMYFGTSHGLYTYDKDKHTYRHYTTLEGLTNDVVCGIAEDQSGNMWLSTFNGLSRFIPEEERFTPYLAGNGLKGSNYVRSIYATGDDGLIYFANDHSVVYINPGLIVTSPKPHDVTLTRLTIHHNSDNSTTDSDYISDKPIEELHRFTLSHRQDVFSMYFATMDYKDSDNQQIQYRLNDSGRWLSTDPGDMKIQFTRLPAGTWDLQVRALKNGVTSRIAEYRIRILPPWYASWWAITLYIVLLAGMAVWMFRLWARHQLDINNEAKLRFFIDIAHEFRSPITLMKAPLDKLKKQPGNDDNTIRALHNIDRNANRMLQLLNQILDIRKIDKGQMKIACSPTDIVAFTQDVCQVFDYEAERRHVTISFNSTLPSIETWIDRDHFDKIIYNLLSNAMKHTKDGGSIDVSVMTDPTPRAGYPEGQVRISVTDSGPGIRDDQKKQIFERFYQISPRSADGSTGHGLGLNLSRQLAELHHGTIEVENRTDGPSGARFIVCLPLGKKHLADNEMANTDTAAGTASFSKRQTPTTPVTTTKLKYVPKKTNHHLIIVDDDEEMSSFLAAELHSIYHIRTCRNGADALKEIMTQHPDLIISDIMMPDMDGYELLRRIKTNSLTNTIPVILLTSSTDPDNRIKGLQKGADAYLNKPFDMDELLARIEGLINNRRLIKGKFSGAQDQADLVKEVSMKDVDDQLMKNIMKVLNDNVDNTALNVEMLSSEVGLSRAQLHRRMKDITGISCGEFIRNFRLNHAAELLKRGGNIYVTQVAYACGFSNATNFSTTFKKHFGVTPTEYANNDKSGRQPQQES